MTSPSGNRRPLKTRGNPLARRFAAWLSGHDVPPDQISLASIAFAGAGAAMLVVWRHVDGGVAQWLLPLLAIAGIQGRLLCNLCDGMVAVEGGKSTPTGELYNDIPDRIADVVLFLAAGYAAAQWWGPSLWLGVAAAMLAVFTAYVRVLGGSMGAPVRFLGPMAKQHRMAALSAACLVSLAEPVWWPRGVALTLLLGVVVVGSLWTSVRRVRAIHDDVMASAHGEGTGELPGGEGDA